jgi:AraC family transcriptional regulator of adaptative response/methylated-DNA-[protein]-cysteine methyltransferase
MSMAHLKDETSTPHGSRAADYMRIAKAIAFIEAHALGPLALADIAEAAGLPAFQFERLFARWAGVSPLRLKRYLAFRAARAGLDAGASVLEAALDAGLSGPGRLHALTLAVEAVTPGEIKRRGAGLELAYGIHDSPFGLAVVLVSERGVAGLFFADAGEEDKALAKMRARFPLARFRESQSKTAAAAAQIGKAAARVPLHLCGTNLQLKVWEALLSIPPGRTTSYDAVARAAGAPRAVRAVASAIGANPVAYFIPCHRVLRKTGALGGYAGGLPRKRAMLAYEALRSENPSTSIME